MLSNWWLSTDKYSEIKAGELPFKRDSLTALDIIKPNRCDLCIKVKKRQEWSWDSFYRNKFSWKVYDYWVQVVNDSFNNSGIPILFFTKNGHPWYVAVSEATCYKINESESIFFVNPKFRDTEIAIGYAKIFFNKVSPTLFLKK